MELIEKLKGTGVCIVTPFHRYGTVDFNSLKTLVDHVIDNGVDYIVVLSNTAEVLSLSLDERNAVVEFVKETTDGRVPLILCINDNNTQALVNSIKTTDFDGIDGIISDVPRFNNPRQKGIYYHFKTISSICPLPLIINNPIAIGEEGIQIGTVLGLANEYENIIAINEVNNSCEHCMELINQKPEGFFVIGGNDLMTIPFLAMGGDGILSDAANAFPFEFASLTKYCRYNNYEQAREVFNMLFQVLKLIQTDGKLAGIKAVLDILSIVQNHLRLPMVKASKSTYIQLKNALEPVLAE